MSPAAPARPVRSASRGQIVPRSRVSADGQPTWLVRVFLRREKGVRKYHSVNVTGSRRDAQKALTELLGQLDGDKLRSPSKHNVEEYLTTWLQRAKSRTTRARVHEGYRVILTRYIVPHLGQIKLLKLTALDVQKAVNALEDHGLSARTVRLTIGLLRSALNQAVLWGMVPRNPIDAKGTLAFKPGRKRPPKYLTTEQAQALLAGTREERDGPLWHVLLASGVRPSEALGLAWSSVDFKAGMLKVTRSLQPDGTFAEPKTEKGRRAVQVTPATMATLKTHRARQLEERLAAGAAWHDADLVFPDETGRPMPHDRILKTLHRRCRAIALPVIGPYHLRHTSATLALESGVPLKTISERLGHTTITLTADVYAHVTPRMDEDVALKMAVALGE